MKGDKVIANNVDLHHYFLTVRPIFLHLSYIMPTGRPTLRANVAMQQCGCGQTAVAFCFTMKTYVKSKFNTLIYFLNPDDLIELKLVDQFRHLNVTLCL